MTTPRLGAPELVTSQTDKEETVNEQIRYIESGAGHFIFKDRDLATPPGSPADGDCYLVAGSPTGAWAGHTGDIAFRLNTVWVFIEAIEGFTAWVNDENVFIGYDGAAWNTLSAPSGTYLPLTGGTLSGDLVVPDEAYDATGWNGSLEVPTKNAIRDKIESLAAGYTDEQAQDAVGGMVDGSLTYVDATPLLQRAALTGDVTASAGSNSTTVANANYSATLTATGTPVATTIFAENFDSLTVPALPAGWTASNAVGPAPLWVTSSSTVDSAPNTLFVDDPGTTSDKRLELH